jgi:uncharacterized protein (TIGR00304 family)
VRTLALVSVVLLVAGGALVAFSVADGGASVSLFVIIPVVSGSSLSFLLGVLLLFVGFLSLPFALASEEEDEPTVGDRATARSEESGGGFGGVVLVGPVPVVFGSWKRISHRARWVLAVLGAVLFTATVVWVALFLR